MVQSFVFEVTTESVEGEFTHCCMPTPDAPDTSHGRGSTAGFHQGKPSCLQQTGKATHIHTALHLEPRHGRVSVPHVKAACQCGIIEHE